MFVFEKIDRNKYHRLANWMKENQDVTIVDDPELNYPTPSEKYNWAVVCWDDNRSTDVEDFDYKYPVGILAGVFANRRTMLKPMLISNEFKNMDIEKGLINAIEILMKNDSIKKYTAHFNDEYYTGKCLEIYGENSIYRNDKSGIHFNVIIGNSYEYPDWFIFNI